MNTVPVQPVWFDPNLFNTDNSELLNTLLDEYPTLQTFVEEHEFYALIEGRANRRVILIVSGRKGEEVLPRIHDRLDIISIYIYCGQIEKYKYLEEKYSKVRLHS